MAAKKAEAKPEQPEQPAHFEDRMQTHPRISTGTTRGGEDNDGMPAHFSEARVRQVI